MIGEKNSATEGEKVDLVGGPARRAHARLRKYGISGCRRKNYWVPAVLAALRREVARMLAI